MKLSNLKNTYKIIMMAAYACAKWDYEVSQTIVKDRRRLVIVVIMVFLPLVLTPVFAADLPVVLGGKKAYAPAFSTNEVFLGSIFIGLIAGLITGCIGAGGGFIITPALMSLGVRGILAVGTDQFHIFAKSIMGTVIHKKLGNVCVPLAIAFCAGSLIGATAGGSINRAIYYANPILSDTFISIIYVLLLGSLGIFAFRDFLSLRKRIASFDGGNPEHIVGTTKLALKLQSVYIPPMVKFDEDLYPSGKRISAWFVAGCGFVVGFMAAIMGVGGGFLTFPMYVYMLGVSSFTTVGTDIFQIIITAGYSSIFQYAIYGFVFYTLAMGLLLGSLIGIQIGSLVTKVVKGLYIRGFYATVILAGFVNRLFALPDKLYAAGIIVIDKALCKFLNLAGIVIFFAIVIVFAAWVLWVFFANMNTLREV